jgi:hypothetical protein
MRLPQFHVFTGTWIFAGAVASAIAVPMTAGAANSTVAIGNPSGNRSAYVAPTRQLQTTIIAPNDVVHAGARVDPGSGCIVLYAPPAGKAIVVNQVTYDLNSGAEGTESYAAIEDASTCGDFPTDFGDTVHAYEAQSHTFPTGVPMPGVYASAGGTGYVIIMLTGYLIPATELPPEAPAPSTAVKGMVRR